MSIQRPLFLRTTPRRLRHQLMALVVLITVLAMALLYAISTQRVADVAFDGSRQWAEAVARTAASAGAEPMAQRDLATLERTLADIAAMPGVLRIDALQADGAPLLSLKPGADGRVRSRWRADDVQHPADSPRGARRVALADGTEALQVWAPLGNGGALGSIGVSFALDTQRQQIERLRYDAVVGIAFVSLLVIGSMHLLLVRALRPLARLVHFSRTLAEHTGGQLPADRSSVEMAEMTEALNVASATLHSQLEALRTTEERTHAIVNAVPDAIIGADRSGRITIASPAVGSVFGHAPDELVGVALTDLLPELDPEAAEQRTLGQGTYMRASRAHVARFETRARRLGGTEFPAEVSVSRVEGADGPRYVCVVRDLTEQHMAQDMLNLYSRALECTSNGVVISDLSLPGQPVFYANPAFYRITGYEPGDAIGRNCAFLQREDTAQPELEVLREAIRERRSATVVLRNYRKDGTLFFNELAIAPVDAGDGQVRHFVGVLNDVTERERTRLAIAERSARLNAVFDLSPDGFVVFDREGQLVYTNRAFLGMTGWDAEALAEGVSLAEFDARLRGLCASGTAYAPLSMTSDDGGAFETVDLLHLSAPRPRVLTRLVRHNAGGQGESILYFRDVTHETEVDRMKSEFLTTAAHELRTPMVSVFGFTELLLNRPVPEGKRRDVLETIHRQASLLIHMVNELLDLARIEARQGKDLVRTPHRLSELVAQAIEGLRVPGDARPVQQHLAHPDAVLQVDAEKLHRALTNVLSNAYKYSPGGGAIELHTVEGRQAGRPAVGVRIVDHGIGMTPEQTARVFERFFRADPSGNIPGTGLGMSLVKEIVELHDGRVEVDSEPGRGTQVTLWLPLADTTPARARTPEAIAGAAGAATP